MATTEGLPGPDGLDEDQREAVETLLYRLADDEFVAAERYTEWQVKSPTLESDLALSNVAQDELGHARLWYDLLEDFGYEEPDLVWERPADEWHHATLTELPFAEGDWADLVVRTYLYDTAEAVRLAALEESSYPRIRDRIGKILGEEDFHVEHAERWTERLCEEADSRERMGAALTRLFPHALTLFEPVDESVESRIDDLGVRTATLDEMREEWLDTVRPYLESVGLGLDDVPRDEDGPAGFALPDAVGRDTSHTDDWAELVEDVTHTYRELGRGQSTKIMRDPDDAES
jgi:ring-1,2-phenylacetyl-CoA epoxidase subunit PaaC